LFISKYFEGTISREEILESIYVKYSNSLYRMSLFYLKNIQDAEEVVSDTFIKIIEKNPKFNDENHEKYWILKTCANICKDRLRSNWFKKRVEDFDFDTIPFESSEEREALEALMNLPVKYRNPIYLHYYEGYSILEISEILRINENTVRSQLSRGRNIMKKYLEEEKK